MKINRIIRREGIFTTVEVSDSYDSVKLGERLVTKKGTEVIVETKCRLSINKYATHVMLRTTAWSNEKIYLRAGMYLRPQS